MKHGALVGTVLLAALAGCGSGEEAAPAVDETATEAPSTASAPAETAGASAAQAARAVLLNAEGDTVGTAEITQAQQGITLAVDVSGVPAGEHGFHIHETGSCEAPDFTSAGGHLNPDQKEHGFESAGGPHMGDFRNLEVGEDGTAQQEYVNERATMEALFDADGSAVVLHAGPDDYTSQPSGDAGSRLACGVISR